VILKILNLGGFKSRVFLVVKIENFQKPRVKTILSSIFSNRNILVLSLFAHQTGIPLIYGQQISFYPSLLTKPESLQFTDNRVVLERICIIVCK